jgi:L-2-hydroxycarboxylate dehydrogenase (NAD+)
MADETVYIPVDTLHQFMIDVFLGCGVPSEDAKICADVLITSDMRGIESHGVQRLKMYYDRIKSGIQQAVTQFEVVRETPATALVDGHHGMGQVIGHHSMELAIQKARAVGVGAVAAKNSTHFGIDGYYAQMAADAGLIGMSFTNARPSIAPTFGVQPMMGTNPIAFAVPTDEDHPFLFDAATSIIQRGKVEIHARTGEPLPEGLVIDQNGQFATDPNQILKGLANDTMALLPIGGAGEDFAGYKGYGLAAMVEILCASLQSGFFMKDLLGFDEHGNKRPFGLGHFFLAINIEAFVELDKFKATTGAILRELRNSRKVPGQERIYVAGEKEFEKEKQTRITGIPILPSLQKELAFMRDELGLTQYLFPF